MTAKRMPRWLSLYAVLGYAFLYAPIVIIIVFSFNESRLGAAWTGFTLDWYRTLFHNDLVLTATKNTFIVAIISTLISTLIGTLLGVGLARYIFPGKQVFLWFMYVPVVIPEIIMAVSLIIFYNLLSANSADLANTLGQVSGFWSVIATPLAAGFAAVSQLFKLGLGTIIMAHITFQIPFVAIVVRSRMSGFDSSLEEAARDLGANEARVFWNVTLPLIMPGVVSAGLLAFTLSIDDFVITFFTSGPGSSTLPVYIYGAVKRGVRPDINALSTIIVAVTVIALLLSNAFQSRQPAKS